MDSLLTTSRFLPLRPERLCDGRWWLLFLIPQALGFEHLTSVAFWMGYLALCVVALFYLSKQWIRLDGNRFFTIGLKRVMQRRRAAAQR